MTKPRRLPEQADVAFNTQYRPHERALLHALLQSTDYGILMNGLDRQDIAANRRLGELFAITPDEVVQADPDSVRKIALSRVRDKQAFEALLLRTDADPLLKAEDEVELATHPTRFLRRATGPVYALDGTLLGRIWTFLDITETRLLQEQVAAQLVARTRDFETTGAILDTMNAFSRAAVAETSSEELIAAFVRPLALLLQRDCVALVLLDANATQAEGTALSARKGKVPILLTAEANGDLFGDLPQFSPHGGLQWKAYRNAASSSTTLPGCCRCVVTPLWSENRVQGWLLIGAEKTDSNLTPEPTIAAHLNALLDQIALTLKAHRLQRELTQAMETLRATQEKIVEIEKLRTSGMLAASVAHDIRNILSALQVEISMQPESVSQALNEQINRFSTLTYRLLAYTRPGVLATNPTSLESVIRHVMAVVSGQADIGGVTMRLALPARFPVIAADSARMENLFVNLCLNAFQAMSETGGELTFTGEVLPGWVRVFVRDTGRGIAPETMERLFDPFFTTRATGFGLGLFSCKRIVEEHGGQLTVESRPGEGACFTVLLPSLREENDHAASVTD